MSARVFLDVLKTCFKWQQPGVNCTRSDWLIFRLKSCQALQTTVWTLRLGLPFFCPMVLVANRFCCAGCQCQIFDPRFFPVFCLCRKCHYGFVDGTFSFCPVSLEVKHQCQRQQWWWELFPWKYLPVCYVWLSINHQFCNCYLGT